MLKPVYCVMYKHIYIYMDKSACSMNKRPLCPAASSPRRGFFDERVRAAMNTRIRHLKFGNTPEENCETPRIRD